MRNQGQLFIGLILVFAGVLFLAGTVFNINMWAFCWPLGLIMLGVWLIARPQMAGPDTRFMQQFIGEIRREGAWQVEDRPETAVPALVRPKTSSLLPYSFFDAPK
jgi:hypothetical protein